ncbi:hypothetical protein KC19_10G085800 [Ceratodon purpureus]|uniref:Protein Iojap, chloroplastic n=1 Tax=Ceratodon purpureus TaxID=3225 RepID=A0A8T0GJL0_CERPU|nr:hypothetical protein KC19_10G085800 [Ceratodon purpureus]
MPHPHQVLALQQCNPTSLWQVPTSSCGHSLSVRAQASPCTSMPVLQVASSSGVRTKGFSLSSQRFMVSPRTASQRCNSISNTPTGRNTEEMQDAEFDQLGEDDLDSLFEEYGETVKNDAESSNVTSEVDDDSDSLAFAVALAEAANDVKGSEIQVLCVKPLIYWTRFFVVVTAFSKPQIDAVGKRMRDIAEEKFNRSPKGDSKPNAWTLLDFGDVVVHIFLPKEREFYNLEEFYGNATLVPLPFENRSMQ